MQAISSYHGNRHRLPARHKHTHRQDRLQYTAPLASAQCNESEETETGQTQSEQRMATLIYICQSQYGTVINYADKCEHQSDIRHHN